MNVESRLCLSLVEPDFMLLMFPGNTQEDCSTVMQFTSAKKCEFVGNLKMSFILLLEYNARFWTNFCADIPLKT